MKVEARLSSDVDNRPATDSTLSASSLSSSSSLASSIKESGLHVETERASLGAVPSAQDSQESPSTKREIGGPSEKTSAGSQNSSPYQRSSSPSHSTSSSSVTGTRASVSTHPNFVYKLHDILTKDGDRGLIAWRPEGTSFTVSNIQRFSQELLPQYFKHTNYNSFVRQLNMYGFHKVASCASKDAKTKGAEIQVAEFAHPQFQRDKPDLMKHIKRRPAGGDAGSSLSSSNSVVLTSLNGKLDPMQMPHGSAHYPHGNAWHMQNSYYGHPGSTDQAPLRPLPVVQGTGVYGHPAEYPIGNAMPLQHGQQSFPQTAYEHQPMGVPLHAGELHERSSLYQHSTNDHGNLKPMDGSHTHARHLQHTDSAVTGHTIPSVSNNPAYYAPRPQVYDQQHAAQVVHADASTVASNVPAVYAGYGYHGPAVTTTGSLGPNGQSSYGSVGSFLVQGVAPQAQYALPSSGASVSQSHYSHQGYNAGGEISNRAYEDPVSALKLQVDELSLSLKQVNEKLLGQERLLSQAAMAVSSLLDILRDRVVPAAELSPSLVSSVNMLRNTVSSNFVIQAPHREPEYATHQHHQPHQQSHHHHHNTQVPTRSNYPTSESSSNPNLNKLDPSGSQSNDSNSRNASSTQ